MKPSKLILSLAAVVSIFTAKAQDKEFGIFIGTAQYQGDLSEKHITISETKLAFGALGRYYFNPRFDVKVGLNYGWIEGSDANYASTDHDRLKRNLSFKSHVAELSGIAELNLLPYISNSKKYRFAPFVFGGLGVYHFNPKAEFNGSWVALRPLGTEGQTLPGGKKYSPIQLSIPYGIGLKYSLGNFWNLGLEIGQRKLFTDYLDDVSTKYPDFNAMEAAGNHLGVQLSQRSNEVNSDWAWNADKGGPTIGDQRGDPKKKDMYVFAGFTITKTIRRFSCTNF